MKVNILPYKMGSGSAKNLANRLTTLLGRKVWRVSNGWTQRKPTTVINWGSSEVNVHAARILNANAKQAGNKLTAFKLMEGKCNVPEFTEDINVAKTYFKNNGSSVVCRTILKGHSGIGIKLAKMDGELVPAPLYVKYIPKTHEFRVHVAFGKVIDVQQKKQRADAEEVNHQIRNHHTGWVYCRDDIQITPELEEQAIKACQALVLDFGAVDIIWNKKYNKYYVLEVNTAPGLEGQTVESYAQAFMEYLK